MLLVTTNAAVAEAAETSIATMPAMIAAFSFRSRPSVIGSPALHVTPGG
jgi:hypothetical protein